MNTAIIREALELARDTILNSVTAHNEFDSIAKSGTAGDAEALKIAEELSVIYDDCNALVAVCRALKELGDEGKP